MCKKYVFIRFFKGEVGLYDKEQYEISPKYITCKNRKKTYLVLFYFEQKVIPQFL